MIEGAGVGVAMANAVDAVKAVADATNEIKTEITKSAEKQGVDLDVMKDVKKEIDEVKDGMDDFTGPIKRNF